MSFNDNVSPEFHHTRIVCSPLFGLITDHSGLTAGLFLAGAVFTFFGDISLVFFLKNKAY